MKIKKKEATRTYKDYKPYFLKKKAKAKRFLYKVAKRKLKIRNFKFLIGSSTNHLVTNKIPKFLFKEKDFLSSHTDVYINYGSSVLKGTKINKAEGAILKNTTNIYKCWRNGPSIGPKLIGSSVLNPWFYNTIPDTYSLSRGYFYLQSYIFSINLNINKPKLKIFIKKDTYLLTNRVKILDTLYLL